MLAVPDEYGRGQHRHEQAAAEREANGEAGAGVPCSGMRRRELWRAGRRVEKKTGAAVTAVGTVLTHRPKGTPAPVLADFVAGRAADIKADHWGW